MPFSIDVKMETNTPAKKMTNSSGEVSQYW